MRPLENISQLSLDQAYVINHRKVHFGHKRAIIFYREGGPLSVRDGCQFFLVPLWPTEIKLPSFVKPKNSGPPTNRTPLPVNNDSSLIDIKMCF